MKKFLVSTNGHEFVMVAGVTAAEAIRQYAERDNVMNSKLYEDTGRELWVVEPLEVQAYSVSRIDVPKFQVMYLGNGKP